MPVAPSFDDMLGQFEAEALAVRSTLAFNDGDVTEAQAHGAGAMADAAIRFNVQAFRETFIDGAKGDALTALVDDHLNIQRSPATSAQAAVAFTRTGAGAGATYLAGSVVASQFDAAGNTVLYTLNADAVFPGGSNGPIAGVVTAQIAGRGGNVAAGAIARIVTAPPAALATLAVTNALAAGGGNEEESDDELRVRARLFWQTLRRGTIAALEFGALTVPSVRIARATEDPITGIVTLLVTDSDGNSTAQMVADVVLEIENWRAAGSLVTVTGGTPLSVAVTGSLVVVAGLDPAVLAPLAVAAVTARMRKLRQGERFYLDMAKAAAISVDPDAIEAFNITAPVGDVTPSASQVVRPGVITIT
jgi:hypothetical protein